VTDATPRYEAACCLLPAVPPLVTRVRSFAAGYVPLQSWRGTKCVCESCPHLPSGHSFLIALGGVSVVDAEWYSCQTSN